MGKAMLISATDDSMALYRLIKEKARDYSSQLDCLNSCTLFVGPCPEYDISPEDFFTAFNTSRDAEGLHEYCCYAECTFDNENQTYVRESIPKAFQNILQSTLTSEDPWLRYSFDLSDRLNWHILMRFPGEGFISGTL